MRNIDFLLSCIIIVNSTAFADQIVTEIALQADEGIIFNQSNELITIEGDWREQNDFDLYLIMGNCPTVCGARCPVDMLSKFTMYVYTSDDSNFPLYSENLDLSDGDFDTSSRYFETDSLQYYTISLVDYLNYAVCKSSQTTTFCW